VRLWSAKTGVQLSVLEGHIFPVSSVSFATLDRQQIASCSQDRTVRLWDMNMTESRIGLPSQSREVSCVGYSPDGQHIASGGSDKTVWQWTASTGESHSLVTDYTTTICCLAYSPNGKQIATAGYDTGLRLSDAQTGAVEHELWGHFGSVSGLAFSPCGQWIASSSFDTTVKLWNTQLGTPGNILSGHESGVTCVAFSPSGHQIVSGSEDGGVRIWDSNSGVTALVLTGHDDGAVRAIAYAPNGQQIASCGEKTVHLWDASTGALCASFGGHAATLVSLSYSPCGEWLVVGGMSGFVYLWRNQSTDITLASVVSAWSCVLVLEAFHETVTGVDWSPCNGDLEFVTGCEDRSVRVWRIVEGNDKSVRVCMSWGSGSGRLGVWDANIQGAVDLSEVNIKLLLQRGAIEGPPMRLEQSKLYVETVAV
jgi:WD40 repeat protein